MFLLKGSKSIFSKYPVAFFYRLIQFWPKLIKALGL